MCFHVITAIFVIIFALSLHIIDNAYGYSIESGRGGYLNWAGIKVSGVFIYDLVLYLLIGFQLIVIVLILVLYWNSRIRK